MPASYGTRPWSSNPLNWIVWVIAAGVAVLFREVQYLSTRTKTASPSEKAAWTYRALLSSALVVAEFLFLYKVLVRLDNPIALGSSWLVLLLLPRPVPRLPLVVARFLVFTTTMAWLLEGFKYLGTAWPTFEPWTVFASFLCMCSAFVWVVAALRPHHQTRKFDATASSGETSNNQSVKWSNVPTTTLADVGGYARVKEEVRLVAENRFSAKPSPIVRNGILLYGPQGTGKNLLAEATAGECRANFYHVRCPELMRRYIGESSEEIRRVFEWAAVNRPIVLFLDEIDSIGSRKQAQGNGTDSGGGGREFNLVATQLMQSIDQYRQVDGLLIMAATNYLDGLEPTLVRDGRFDAKLRLDLPSEEERKAILAAQLTAFPSHVQELSEIARRTPGWSPARLKGLVERAALATKGNLLEEKHLIEALEHAGGHDRPAVDPVNWEDVVLPARDRCGPAGADRTDGARQSGAIVPAHSHRPDPDRGAGNRQDVDGKAAGVAIESQLLCGDAERYSVRRHRWISAETPRCVCESERTCAIHSVF